MLPGEWTTYGDLGAAASGSGQAARLAARLAARHPEFANAHRVLAAGGVVTRGPGGESAASAARARLLAEGVPFRGRRADPACRVGWIELRGRLAEQDAHGEGEQRPRPRANAGPRPARYRPTA